MREFFIIWRDEVAKRWWPVGKLIDLGSMYVFVYTKGAELSENFKPFPKMQQMRAIYLSNELFPVFKNRVMKKSRPDYNKYALWSGQAGRMADPVALMGTMGGERATDMLQVYPLPTKDELGKYVTTFFCHGLSHLPLPSQDRANTLFFGEKLYPMLDRQNPFDEDAVALRTSDPAVLIGYCPRHLCFDIRDLIDKHSVYISLTVERVNPDAPPQFRLLCRADAVWPKGFQPCDRDVYEPLLDYKSILKEYLNSEDGGNNIAIA